MKRVSLESKYDSHHIFGITTAANVRSAREEFDQPGSCTERNDEVNARSKTAIVTGASSGIGQATAERLTKAGYRVYGTSRRGATAGQQRFEMLPLDVTSDESVESAVSDVIRSSGRIDVLVNNAGVSVVPAGAEESSIEQARSIFDTNFFGIVRMTRAVVPHAAPGSGRILNIGSVLGFLPAPYMALYAATKHAVEGYSESLDHELRTRGIRVSVIEPAYTKTALDANALEPDSKLEEYREVGAALSHRISAIMATSDEPGVVADVVLRAALAVRPKLRYTAGSFANRLRWLRRFAPAGLMDAGIRRNLRLDTPAVTSLRDSPVPESPRAERG
ncbi:MAG: oxidoreductase [Holophagales bacterium]|nr:oxidoreductase [Holophagales bacterium]